MKTIHMSSGPCCHGYKYYKQTYPLCDLVNLLVTEVVVGIEVLVLKQTLTYNFVWNLALEVHHELEHLIVRGTGEQYFASVEFIDCRTNRPQVYSMVIWHSYNCN